MRYSLYNKGIAITLTEAQSFTEMPCDFIPTKANLNPTKDEQNPIANRFQWLSALDKRTSKGPDGQSLRGSMISETSDQDVVKYIMNLRSAAIAWSVPRIEEILADGLEGQYGDQVRMDGRKIKNLSDLCEWIKRGPMTNFKRGVISFASDGLWGNKNQFAINMEVMWCNMMRIKLIDVKSNGHKPKKEHEGKCFAKLFVQRKGALVEVIRNTTKRVFKEAIYNRTEPARTTANNDAKENSVSKKNVPKLVQQTIATVENYGFNGKLGLCSGHPDLAKVGTLASSVAQTLATTAVSVSDKASANEDAVTLFLKSHGLCSIEDFTRIVEKSKNKNETTPEPSNLLGVSIPGTGESQSTLGSTVISDMTPDDNTTVTNATSCEKRKSADSPMINVPPAAKKKKMRAKRAKVNKNCRLHILDNAMCFK